MLLEGQSHIDVLLSKHFHNCSTIRLFLRTNLPKREQNRLKLLDNCSILTTFSAVGYFSGRNLPETYPDSYMDMRAYTSTTHIDPDILPAVLSLQAGSVCPEGQGLPAGPYFWPGHGSYNPQSLGPADSVRPGRPNRSRNIKLYPTNQYPLPPE